MPASPEPLRLRAIVEATGPAAAFVLTDAQVAMLGGGTSAPVRVTVAARSVAARLARRGGANLVGLSRAARAELAVEIGDEVDVVIDLDAAIREVVVPAELAAALADDPALAQLFASLAFTHRKEFARWVGEAKQEATRMRRAEQAAQLLREGRTR